MNGVKYFNIINSPFYKNRHLEGKTKNIAFRLPIEAYDDLKEYFEGVYGEDGALSKGFKELSYNTLDGVCTEKKCFDNLHVFMLIPKTDDIDELCENSEIIAFIDEDTDFPRQVNTNIFKDGKPEYPNIIHDLTDFNKENVPLSIFQDVRDLCVYRTSRTLLDSFDSFKNRLYELYPNLNLDDCYYVSFDINNYFDRFRNGQYQSESINDDHLSSHILIDERYMKRHYLIITWNYSLEDSAIRFDFFFVDSNAFYNFISRTLSDEGDEELGEAIHESFMNVEHGEIFKDRLLSLRKGLIETIKDNQFALDSVNNILKNDFPDEYEKLDDID